VRRNPKGASSNSRFFAYTQRQDALEAQRASHRKRKVTLYRQYRCVQTSWTAECGQQHYLLEWFQRWLCSGIVHVRLVCSWCRVPAQQSGQVCRRWGGLVSPEAARVPPTASYHCVLDLPHLEDGRCARP
jgi:hypothetical protein